MGSQLCIKRIYSKKGATNPRDMKSGSMCSFVSARLRGKIRERETSVGSGEVKDLPTQVPFDIYLRLRYSRMAAITANTNPKPVITNPMYSILPIYTYIIRNMILESNQNRKNIYSQWP